MNNIVDEGALACPFHGEAVLPQALAQRFDPFDMANPFAFYRIAREQAPLFYCEELGHWVLARHKDIKAVLMDWRTFSAENAQQPLTPWSPEVVRILADGGFVGGSGLSARVPPEHTRIRSAVVAGLGATRFRRLEPAIRARTRSMIAALQARGRADIVAELAYELPAYTILQLLGVPDGDVAQVKRWAESRVLLVWGNLAPEQQVPHARNLVDYWRYCETHVAKCRAVPGDNLPSDLLRRGAISDREAAGVCWSLLFAGHETTSALIANGLNQLLSPDVWPALVADPGKIDNAIEEVLRFTPSVMAWRRKALRNAVIGGHAIPAGALLLLLIGSANRDGEVFPNGDQFDIHRPDARRHLAFGQGIHFCLGAPLARMQAKVVVEELARALPGLKVVPGQVVRYSANVAFRSPLALHVQWGMDHEAPILQEPVE
jgi:cytochrome P450